MYDTIPSIITQKENEIPSINLKIACTEQDMCALNCRMLMKDIKEDLNKWRDILYILCSLFGGSCIIKMSLLHKLTLVEF